MSLGEQNFGFDPANPVVLGKKIEILFVIPDLLVAGVSSVEWILADTSPRETPSPNVSVTKTNVSGIQLTDGAEGLEVLVTMDPIDTAALSGGDYFHRLDYVHTDGSEQEAARGTGRLTPRA